MLEYLKDLKSALETIFTKGTDTLVMSRCLESLAYQIQILSQKKNNDNQKQEE